MTLLDYTTEDFLKAIYQPASSSVEMNDSAHQSQCKGTHFEAEVSDILAYFTTLSCFCKRPANRYYTLEYGPILECASYDKTKSFYNPRFVCGFHVHELAWLRLLNQLQEGYPICSRYLELRACPLFNFTYCALFKVYNDYPSIPVSFPTCFCNKPIKMVHDQFKEKQDKLEYIAPTSIKPKIITNFICANRNVQGAPKCNWMNPADKSVFSKPKYQLHSQVDELTYNAYTRVLKDDVNASMTRFN